MSRIRPARPGESAALTALALRSKAYWGYDAAFMATVATELRWDEDDLRSMLVHVAERDDGSPAAFAAVNLAPDPPELDALFVDPPAIGEGLGRALLETALRAARERGIAELAIDSDPGAEAFYAHCGARRVGEVRSPSTGRMLPRLLIGTGAG